MKVCKVEDFPGDKIECKNCPYYLPGYNICKHAQSRIKKLQNCKCPSEGCRDDCPFIPCEGIKDSLEFLDGMVLYEGSVYEINDDSIRFIKACEDNQ